MEKSEFINHLSIQGNKYQIFNISGLEDKGIATVSKLPFSIKILVEKGSLLTVAIPSSTISAFRETNIKYSI